LVPRGKLSPGIPQNQRALLVDVYSETGELNQISSHGRDCCLRTAADPKGFVRKARELPVLPAAA
jgi:hypothetical protein